MFLFQIQTEEIHRRGRSVQKTSTDPNVLAESKIKVDTAITNIKNDPDLAAKFNSFTKDPKNPNGLDITRMSNTEVITTLQNIRATLSIDVQQAAFASNPEKLAEALKKVKDLDAFLSTCKINWSDIDNYMEYMRLDELNRSKTNSDKLNEVKSVNRGADFAIRTTGKTNQAANTKLEGDLAKLRDLIPRKTRINPDLKPPTEFA